MIAHALDLQGIRDLEMTSARAGSGAGGAQSGMACPGQMINLLQQTFTFGAVPAGQPFSAIANLSACAFACDSAARTIHIGL